MNANATNHQRNAYLLHGTAALAFLTYLILAFTPQRSVLTFRTDEGIWQLISGVAGSFALFVVPVVAIYFSFKRPRDKFLVVLSILWLLIPINFAGMGALDSVLGSTPRWLDTVRIWIFRVAVSSYALLGVAALVRVSRRNSVEEISA